MLPHKHQNISLGPNQVHSRFKCTQLSSNQPTSYTTYRPVTQRNIYPSSCRQGMSIFLISSSDIVPYGSSMWMSHGGSAMITANLPRMVMSNCLMSHFIHYRIKLHQSVRYNNDCGYAKIKCCTNNQNHTQ